MSDIGYEVEVSSILTRRFSNRTKRFISKRCQIMKNYKTPDWLTALDGMLHMDGVFVATVKKAVVLKARKQCVANINKQMKELPPVATVKCADCGKPFPKDELDNRTGVCFKCETTH